MTDEAKRRAQEAFLEVIGETGIISRAARQAGVSRKTVYNWLKNEPDFAEKVRDAEDDARDVIRAEIHRRAVDGVDEPVYQGGHEVGKITKYSDSLLAKMANARLPEYRNADNQSKYLDDVTQDGSAPARKVEVTIREVSDWDSVSRTKS